jgi:hypothetical protein
MHRTGNHMDFLFLQITLAQKTNFDHKSNNHLKKNTYLPEFTSDLRKYWNAVMDQVWTMPYFSNTK